MIASGYRSPAHNKKADGAANSYHVKGQAIDHHTGGIIGFLVWKRMVMR